MSCDEICPLLPGVVYADLAPDDSAQVHAHLASCAACQRELTGLQLVRQQLDCLPMPAVRVDIARLYQEASRRQNRRWRRWLIAGAGLAAAVMVGLLALKLEIRTDGEQLVLRWGTPPPAPLESQGVPMPSPPAVLAATPETEERLKLLVDFVNALARDVEHRDADHKETIAKLQVRVNSLQRLSNDRLAATERDVAALYNVQFNPNAKGADQ